MSVESDDAAAKRYLDRRLDAYDRQVFGYYNQALKDIRAQIALLYERYSANGKLTYAEMSKYNRLAALEKYIAETLGPVFSKITKTIERMSRIEYEEAFYRFAYNVDRGVGTALAWGLLREESIIEAVANPMRLIAESRLKTGGLLRVRSAVTQGLIRGDSFPRMSRAIRDAINGAGYDATRIVRTEGQRAQVLGQQETYSKARDLGVDVVDVWDATLDSRVRTSHAALDGVEAKYRANGEPYWQTEVGEVRGPLQSGVASFDIHCRCRTSGKVKGYEPQVRRVRGEGVMSQQSYEEFRAKFLRKRRAAEARKR